MISEAVIHWANKFANYLIIVHTDKIAAACIIIKGSSRNQLLIGKLSLLNNFLKIVTYLADIMRWRCNISSICARSNSEIFFVNVGTLVVHRWFLDAKPHVIKNYEIPLSSGSQVEALNLQLDQEAASWRTNAFADLQRRSTKAVPQVLQGTQYQPLPGV